MFTVAFEDLDETSGRVDLMRAAPVPCAGRRGVVPVMPALLPGRSARAATDRWTGQNGGPDAAVIRTCGTSVDQAAELAADTGGEHLDVTYNEAGGAAEEIVERIISTFAKDNGVLRCRHGDRLVILYGRGIATLEVAPRGAVL